MTKQEAIKNHRKMWNWIADQIEERKEIVTKSDYFDEIGMPIEECPLEDCFCCEYAKKEMTSDCNTCPIKWPDESKSERFYCAIDGSPYKEFYDLLMLKYKRSSGALNDRPFDYKRAAELTRQIANLPEREGVIVKEDIGNVVKGFGLL